MRLSETFRTSVRALNSNKVRSFLTMLGVIIGVFSVVTLISIGRGIQNYMTDQFNALGSNLVFVLPGRIDFSGQRDPGMGLMRNKLDQKHIDLINTYHGNMIEGISPQVELGDTVKYRNRSFYAGIQGVNYRVGEVFGYEIDKGEVYNRAQENAKARVAVIGPSLANDLFPNKNPVGQTVKVNGQNFKIIGVFKEKGRNFDNLMYMPYTTAMDVFDIKNYSSIIVKAKSADDVETLNRQLKTTLSRDLKEDEFTVMTQTDILSSIQAILGIFTAGMGAIAAISLLVGGIGIMNIMLVSVTERTREIGLRKALGATSLNVALQFLIESILLSVGGGVIGLIFGWMAAMGGRAFIRTEVPWWSVALAFGFSVLVGVVFGTYPAIKASKKDPIEALRYE
jgi:putative ABC transport system permease protein